MDRSQAVTKKAAIAGQPEPAEDERAAGGPLESEVVTVPIAALLPGDSPRSEGVVQPHVVALAEVEGPLPPILVERRTMRVVDGMHRLLAALLKGRQVVEVELFDGPPEEAFLRAVQANVVHGLPLSLTDRRAAAERIIMSHAHLSDRAIARTAGLGAKTVAGIRRSSTDAVQQLNTRVGRDGRIRPLNGAEGRRRAVQILAERPEASLREVARLVGISPATVSDVRKRLTAGEPPLTKQIPAQAAGGSTEPSVGTKMRLERVRRPASADPVSMLEKLLRDPSLRHKEGGRQLLRLLHQNAIAFQDWLELANAVPPHCRELVMNLALHYEETWRVFAETLDEPVRSAGNH